MNNQWISLVDKFPLFNQDILIYNEEISHDIGMGWLSDIDMRKMIFGKCDNCDSPIKKCGPLLNCYFNGHSQNKMFILEDALKKDFYWMPVPRFKK